ncbi:ZWICHEL kinesin-like calmodulin-binding protein, partial [Prunus dulcis]
NPSPPLRRQRLSVVATTTTRSHLGRHQVRWNHHLPYFPFHPTTASIRRRARRNQPQKAAVLDRFYKLSTLRSLSFLHQIGRVRYQEPDRILKGDLRGIEAVEVCGIHHRANYSFRAKVKILG